MGNITRMSCVVSEMYPPTDVERIVNEHAKARRKARMRRARERQLHIAGALAGVALIMLVAVAVLLGLIG